MDTRGRGGRKLSKKIKVFTNDPKRSTIILTLFGNVKKYVTVDPQSLCLSGPAGEEITAQATIFSDASFPFKIFESEAKNGEFISWKVEEYKGVVSKYHLMVQNLKQDQGTYYDVIILKTDSKTFPELRISVHGQIAPPEIAVIRPREIFFEGFFGEIHPQTIMIVPKKGFAFKIVECRTGQGKEISCDFKEVNNKGNREYRLMVSNLRKEPGRYSDTIILNTDSEVRPRLIVKVTGDIRIPEIASITPSELILYGTIGETIKGTVMIVPKDKHPFKILDVSFRKGEDISYELEKNGSKYLLTVQNIRKEKGLFTDIIDLKTDSSQRTKLQIKVSTMIFGQDEKELQDLFKSAIVGREKKNVED